MWASDGVIVHRQNSTWIAQREAEPKTAGMRTERHRQAPVPRPSTQRHRSQAQSRFSAFFHGYSVMTRERWPAHPSNPKARRTHHPRRPNERRELPRTSPVSRSRASTRSLIDPISSPVGSPELRSPQELWRYRGAFFRPVSTLAPSQREFVQTESQRQRGSQYLEFLRSRRTRKITEKKHHRRACFPAVTDPKARVKLFGTLISGSLLILILTICK